MGLISVSDPRGLVGRIALVTGSTRGIGWATACAMARQGATVVLNGRTDSGLSARVDALRAQGSNAALGLSFDVAKPAEVRSAYQKIYSEFKRLDVLVNNAGILEDALLGMIPDDAVDRTFAVNAAGPIHNMQCAARLMSRGGGGSIINVSSIIGTCGNEGQVVYAASKAAVIGATRAAAKELAGKGIRVNAVTPGFIDTDMARQIPPQKFQERLASVKMGRVGTPEDVADVIVFFASDQSRYVTGQVLGVDGGMLI